MPKEALYYRKTNAKVACTLCPHNCELAEGKTGLCRVRKNLNGKLISENYQKVCSFHFDPIEKKPLYHFYPGSIIFSVGSVGCNLHCKFCQNWQISQNGVDEFQALNDYSPREIVKMSKNRKSNIGIAYTFNEPTVWFEYMLEIAKLAQREGLKNVMVTNGFINPEPLAELIPFMDAFGVDLKAFNEDFYRKLTSSHLAPVLETLIAIKKSGRHLEITNLVVTNHNDNEIEFRNMIDWIANNLGTDTVLHISRYFPTYKMDNDPTPVETLQQFFEIASKKLNYVYMGNVQSAEGQDTFCKNCNSTLIKRRGYNTEINALSSKGNCLNCGENILPSECI